MTTPAFPLGPNPPPPKPDDSLVSNRVGEGGVCLLFLQSRVLLRRAVTFSWYLLAANGLLGG